MSTLKDRETAKYLNEKYDIDYEEEKADYNLSWGNAKLKKSGIASFNILPIVHCPLAGSCKSYCYATVGQQAFRSGIMRRVRAYKATRQEDFVEVMVANIQKAKKAKAIRIHDSGDFYSREYLEKWVAIAENCPDMKFYAYTKMIPLLRVVKLPPNLRIIQSVGGLMDEKIIAEMPVARIFRSNEERKEAGYDDATETDDVAAFSKTLKVGLVIHGNKKNNF